MLGQNPTRRIFLQLAFGSAFVIGCFSSGSPQTSPLCSETGTDVRADGCSTAKIRVVPRDPAASYLVAKLTGVGMCSGSVMPKAGGELSTSQLDGVRAWIGAGASS